MATLYYSLWAHGEGITFVTSMVPKGERKLRMNRGTVCLDIPFKGTQLMT